MVEMMVRSTSSSSNVHRVIDDNSNPYKNKKFLDADVVTMHLL